MHGSSISTSILSDKPGGEKAAAAVERPGGGIYLSQKTPLRAAVVTSLGKEKVMKVPLFEQEETSYLLTREGRLALGLANDDDDDEWRDREAEARAGRSTEGGGKKGKNCLLYTSPSPRDATLSRMPSSA